MKKSSFKTYILAICAFGLAGTMITHPQVSVDASIRGLKLWWDVVFPSLMPFFILSELMIAFGIVSFMGVLFEPIMRPLFRIPGVGGFVFVMGIVSGFPAGAKISTRLYEEKKLTKTEAERLASFTNFSNPLFIFGVIAIGFFHQASLGIIFALSHYLGNLTVGLIMRFYKSNETTTNTRHSEKKIFILFKAFQTMHEERLRKQKPFGKLLGDAVHNSVTTLLMIGGFIILFSVLNQMLMQIRWDRAIQLILHSGLHLIHFSPEFSKSIIPGIFEITIGAQQISEVSGPLIQKVILVSMILGFCGLSIQAQVMSILSEANLSAKPFLIGRLIHALSSGIFAFILFHFFKVKESKSSFIPTLDVSGATQSTLIQISDHIIQAGSLFTLITLIIFIFLRTKIHLNK
ncbi:sporulation integral membrane protein YlbJ [Terrilactibacillus laevilacticus]|uniref:Sporulation integral membrane protein YlbJ n=1 Tax=Terrilactibacillus laevilacticus TaxID=1380157 RepID=A0ABW5PQ79_9BACI|nr:sporulation integral membrane protein YlbJ [Terrilactibacillus laevilacticus]